MRHQPALAAFALATVVFSTAASAGTISYAIQDILSPTDLFVSNVGQTFTGTGFVGVQPGNFFNPTLGMTGAYGQTNMQVGIGALSGASIVSASLTFLLFDGSSVIPDVHYAVTGYDATGNLGYAFYAPPNSSYGSSSGTLASGESQSLDVTALVQAAVSAGEDWLGLFMAYSDLQTRWTATRGNDGVMDRDRAQVRLNVEYNPAVVDGSVPEPTSLALAGLALGALAWCSRKRA